MPVGLIKVCVSLIVLVFLAHTAQLNLYLLTKLLSHPVLLITTFALFILMVMVNALRWQRLNTVQGIQLRFNQTAIATYLGTAFNNVLPGSVGGDVVRLFYLFRHAPQQKSAALLSVFFDRITGLLGIFIYVSCMTSLHPALFARNNPLFYWLITCIGLCAFGMSAFFISLALPQQMGMSDWLRQRFAANAWSKIIVDFFAAIRIYRNAKWVILECLLLSTIIQMLMVVTLWMITQMMALPLVSFIDFGIASAATQIANLIPVTPGGIGVGEMAFANVLQMLNPHVVAAFATVFMAYRLIGLIIYLPGVLVYVFNFKLKPMVAVEING